VARDDEVRGRLLLEYALENDPELMGQLLDDPESVFERLGVDEEALKCTEEAHRALERAESLAQELEALGEGDLVELLPKAGEIAREKLGSDLTVTKEPFGLRFREKVQDFGLPELTATGTVGGTFRWKWGADADG
jgi:hypothetical protein